MHRDRKWGGRGGLRKGIWEGYVGRKGEEEEDREREYGKGYVGRKGEEEEDCGKGIGGTNVQPQ